MTDRTDLTRICNNPEVFEEFAKKQAAGQQAPEVYEEDDNHMVGSSFDESEASEAAEDVCEPNECPEETQGSVEGLQRTDKPVGVSTVGPVLWKDIHQVMCDQRTQLGLPQMGEGTDEEQEEAAQTLWPRPKQAFIAALLK